MRKKQIARLRQEIERLRRSGGVKSRELQELAKSLGRKRHNRGKEPNWVSEIFDDVFPISIPDHPGDLNKYTARGILSQLENDLDKLEETLADQEG